MSLWNLSLVQFTDGAGRPASSTAKFFRSGTTQRVTVYKDAACTSAHPLDVKSDSLGRMPAVYFKPDGVALLAEIQTGGMKVRALDGIDPGSPASDQSPSLMALPHAAKTGNVINITLEDFGTFVEVATVTGAVIPVGLPRVSLIDNGRIVGVRNKGLGTIALRPTGSDLVNAAKGFVLPANASVLLRSTGAGFATFALTPPPPKRWSAKTRQQKTPPLSPVAGDTYLAPADAIGTWAPNKIYVANGGGEWTGYLPDVGDQVALADEIVQAGTGTGLVKLPLLLTWTGEAWIAEALLAKAYADDSIDAKIAPVAARVTTLETIAAKPVLRVLSSGVSGTASLAVQGGVQPTAGQWTRNKLTSTVGDIAGASVANDIITLPKGRYLARCRRKATGAIAVAVGFRAVSGAGFGYGIPLTLAASADGIAEADVPVTVTGESETFELVSIFSGTVGALTTGVASAITGVDEIYADVTIERLG